jgi:hypothetical protein
MRGLFRSGAARAMAAMPLLTGEFTAQELSVAGGLGLPTPGS